jgi:hypothetical protein
MKCHVPSAARKTPLWAMVTRAFARTVLPKPSCDAAPTPAALPPPKHDGARLTLALPVTLRGVKWNMVKRLDSNTALKRSVIESNRRDLMATLAKGDCSNE